MKLFDYTKNKAPKWLNMRTLGGLLLFGLIWLCLGLGASYILQFQLESAIAESTSNFMQTPSWKFTEQDLQNGLSPEIQRAIESEFGKAGQATGNNVNLLEILDQNGKIVYANHRDLLGTLDNAQVTKAGQPRATLEGNDISIYIPLTAVDTAKPLGMVKINLNASPWVKLLSQSRQLIFAFLLIGGLLVLGGFQIVIKSATDTIERQDEAMEALATRLDESKASLLKTNTGTISALLTALDAKDRYTAKHSNNVATYAKKIAHKLNLQPKDLETLEAAALLHDIGKIGIPEPLLNKPGSLDLNEFDQIKRHPEIGAQIIHLIYVLKEVAEVVRYHHERYDGRGYPLGLAGDEIPLTSRILAVADVYDALTTDRPYRPAMSKARAKMIMSEGLSTQFDPQVLDVFMDLLEQETAA